MKNKVNFFLALVMFLLLGWNGSAQAEEPVDANKNNGMVLIATVNVGDAKIISQDGNVFKISFDLYNRQNVQPQVIYGVELVKQKEGSLPTIEKDGKKVQVFDQATELQIIVDQEIFRNDVISLNSEETVHKEITYSAPSSLDGKYKLMLKARNSEGTIFGGASLGDITLQSAEGSVLIDESSCRISIGDDNSKEYRPQSGGIGVDPGSALKMRCNIENKSNVSSQNIIPEIIIYQRSVFGKVVDNQKFEALTFSPNEKSSKEFTLRVPEQSQNYQGIFVLTDEKGNKISNEIDLIFGVNGEHGMIENVLLDKDSYSKGETANLQVWYLVNGESAEGSSVNILIKDGEGNACSEQFSQKQEADYKSDYSVPIIKNCQNPTAEIAIKNKNGKVLAQNSFAVETKSGGINQEQEQKQAQKSSLGQKAIIAGVILILVLIGLLAFLISKRKGLIVFLGLLFAGSLFFASQASAATYTSPTFKYQVTKYVNKTIPYYNENEDVIFTSEVSVNWPAGEKHSIRMAYSGYLRGPMEPPMQIGDPYKQLVSNGAFMNSIEYNNIAGATSIPSRTETGREACYTTAGFDCAKTYEQRINWNTLANTGCSNCTYPYPSKKGGFFYIYTEGAYLNSTMVNETFYLKVPFQVKNPICGCHSGGCDTAGSCPTVEPQTTRPTASCSFGTASGITDTGTAWCWTCTGQDSGGSPQCCVQKAIVPVDGVCGTAAGGTFASSPTINLCSAGNPSGVWIDSLNRWSWSCYGINGGSSPICTANPPTCVPAACALANTICSGQKYYETNCNTYCGIGTMDCVPVLNFTANGATTTSIDYGAETTLSWEVANATSCTASSIPLASNWSGAKDATATAGVPHTQLTGPLTETIKYTLTCSNSTGNSVTRDVTVNIDSSCIPSYSSYTCTKIDTGLSCDSNNCNQTITTQTGICTGVDDKNNCPDPPALSQEDCIKNGYPCSNIIKTCNNDACSGGGDDWTWIEVKP